ncbi:MAG: hypothetical protein AVDCRST_MAG08-3103, partial [uncultured Acetobacteraceae bacterium]
WVGMQGKAGFSTDPVENPVDKRRGAGRESRKCGRPIALPAKEAVAQTIRIQRG